MFDELRGWLLRVLRVPPEPARPPGAGAVRIFRSAPNYFRYKVVLWAVAQLGALIGLLTGLFFVGSVSSALNAPGLVLTLIRIAEGSAILFYLVQLPISFALLRLDFDMRWYILTDRSLRIREGIVSVSEKTMTFANIQQISVRQNPLQRVLQIADVRVRTAGGGAAEGSEKEGSGLHEGAFRGVAEPETIRRAVLERVRVHRDAGLGDPDDLAPFTAGGGSREAIDAARELHSELRALRAALAP